MAPSVNADAEFKQFDVVVDDSDHSYLNWNKTPINNGNNNGSSSTATADGPDCFSNASSGVHKKIMKEWRVLEQGLPDTIYVRVYERRIDLLRAAIVGPAGTPYHDGIFVFDLAFPPDYPARPPNVHYWSFGLRINPNLYAGGKVCLSLLNTWAGKPNERWNPAESTVLQILVSIQGLVLNSHPYFNEPGVGHVPGWSKRSMAYSETAFVHSCSTMVYLLRRPPRNFEAFVASHFRDRANCILMACTAYVNGRAVLGSYREGTTRSASSSSSRNRIKVSSDFKRSMETWYPQMVVVFKGAGASLGHSVEQLRIEVKEKKKKKTRVKSKIGNVIKVVKKFFGLKKSLGKQEEGGPK